MVNFHFFWEKLISKKKKNLQDNPLITRNNNRLLFLYMDIEQRLYS
jgi:hypothetical protein